MTVPPQHRQDRGEGEGRRKRARSLSSFCFVRFMRRSVPRITVAFSFGTWGIFCAQEPSFTIPPVQSQEAVSWQEIRLGKNRAFTGRYSIKSPGTTAFGPSVKRCYAYLGITS